MTEQQAGCSAFSDVFSLEDFYRVRWSTDEFHDIGDYRDFCRVLDKGLISLHDPLGLLYETMNFDAGGTVTEIIPDADDEGMNDERSLTARWRLLRRRYGLPNDQKGSFFQGIGEYDLMEFARRWHESSANPTFNPQYATQLHENVATYCRANKPEDVVKQFDIYDPSSRSTIFLVLDGFQLARALELSMGRD